MATSTTLTNRRQLRRHKLSAEITILSTLTSVPIGKLVDIHQEGLLILGNPLAMESSHQLSLLLPNSINKQTSFDVGVECLWSQPSMNDGGLTWVGCTIIDKSKNASACIQSLVNITSN